jgi:hypothetical protein
VLWVQGVYQFHWTPQLRKEPPLAALGEGFQYPSVEPDRAGTFRQDIEDAQWLI